MLSRGTCESQDNITQIRRLFIFDKRNINSDHGGPLWLPYWLQLEGSLCGSKRLLRFMG